MERFRAWQEGDGTKGMLEFVIACNNTAGGGGSPAPTEQTASADEAEDEYAKLDADQEITVHVPGSIGTLRCLGLLATPRIIRLLKNENAPCAFSISGGKDGSAAAIAGVEYLNFIGHTGGRILEHCDLGLIEHRDSIRACERLAKALETELVVVKPIREMIEAWRYRWRCNIERYAIVNDIKSLLIVDVRRER